jgi:hypothetical protein
MFNWVHLIRRREFRMQVHSGALKDKGWSETVQPMSYPRRNRLESQRVETTLREVELKIKEWKLNPCGCRYTMGAKSVRDGEMEVTIRGWRSKFLDGSLV